MAESIDENWSASCGASRPSTPRPGRAGLAHHHRGSVKTNEQSVPTSQPVRSPSVGKDYITNQIPEIDPFTDEGYTKIPDVAMYKNADWSKVIGMSRNIPLAEAFKIANKDPEIKFFFYVKDARMVLEIKEGNYRAFNYHDAVFFSRALVGKCTWFCRWLC